MRTLLIIGAVIVALWLVFAEASPLHPTLVARPAVTVDQCPNIVGDQNPVPTGLIKDPASGNCVVPTAASQPAPAQPAPGAPGASQPGQPAAPVNQPPASNASRGNQAAAPSSAGVRPQGNASTSSDLGLDNRYVETGKPSPRNPNPGATMHYVADIGSDYAVIVGGVNVNGVHGDLEVVEGPGKFDKTVTNGFAVLVAKPLANQEYCDRLDEAKDRGWFHENAKAPAGYASCD